MGNITLAISETWAFEASENRRAISAEAEAQLLENRQNAQVRVANLNWNFKRARSPRYWQDELKESGEFRLRLEARRSKVYRSNNCIGVIATESIIHDPLSLRTAQFRRVIGISAYLLAHTMFHPRKPPLAFFLDAFARRLHAVTMFALRIKASRRNRRPDWSLASRIRSKNARQRVALFKQCLPAHFLERNDIRKSKGADLWNISRTFAGSGLRGVTVCPEVIRFLRRGLMSRKPTKARCVLTSRWI